ncbi:hypothetical protein BDV06DRAFT_218351 [Aspergillus oleicola]
MPSIASTALFLCTLAAGYLAARCTTPPTHPSTNTNSGNKNNTAKTTDRIRYLTTTPAILTTYTSILITIYQALITLFSPSSPSDLDKFIQAKLLLYPNHLNTSRVSWSTSTITNLTLIFIGAAIRLSAYGGLGRNFTFHLSRPDRLVKDGIYVYLQHPSYTGLLLLIAGYVGLVGGRLDGTFFCLVPGEIVTFLRKWEGVVGVFAVGVVGVIGGVRIRDEERMLRDRFGREWEGWHKRTARLVPGVF